MWPLGACRNHRCGCGAPRWRRGKSACRCAARSGACARSFGTSLASRMERIGVRSAGILVEAHRRRTAPDRGQQLHADQHLADHGEVVVELPRRLADGHVQFRAGAAVLGVAARRRRPCRSNAPARPGRSSGRARPESRRRSRLCGAQPSLSGRARSSGPPPADGIRPADAASRCRAISPCPDHRRRHHRTAPRSCPARGRCWCRPRSAPAPACGCWPTCSGANCGASSMITRPCGSSR